MCNLLICGISKTFKPLKTPSYIGIWRHNLKFSQEIHRSRAQQFANPVHSIPLDQILQEQRTVHFCNRTCLNAKLPSSVFFSVYKHQLYFFTLYVLNISVKKNGLKQEGPLTKPSYYFWICCLYYITLTFGRVFHQSQYKSFLRYSTLHKSNV